MITNNAYLPDLPAYLRYSIPVQTLPLLAGLSALLALAGWRLGVLTKRGAGAAFAVGCAFAGGAPEFYPALVAMVVLGEAATRLNQLLNPKNGQRRAPGGRRGAGSVLGNGGVAAATAFLSVVVSSISDFQYTEMSPEAMFPLAMAIAGALSAAAADTVAGEIGKAFRAPAYLVTRPFSGTRVAPGTDGAVSIAGTIAGALAAAAIGWIALSELLRKAYYFAGTFEVYPELPYWLFFLLKPLVELWYSALDGGTILAAVAFSGVAASFMDSVLGATIEQGLLIRLGLSKEHRNHVVNFLATLSGALIAAGLAYFLI
ncbi:MAG: DUF92 domain-containing protein [bacterium]|jgi:uncharacterized protein (TIGR00297 family)